MAPELEYELTVVVPVRGSLAALEELLNALQAYHDSASVRLCFLLVDDSASDQILVMLKDWCSSYDDFYYLSLERQSGNSGCLLAACRFVSSPWMGFLAEGLNAPPENFEPLLESRFQGEMIAGVGELVPEGTDPLAAAKSSHGWCQRLRGLSSSARPCPIFIARTQILRTLPPLDAMDRFAADFFRLSGFRVYEVPVRITAPQHRPRQGLLGRLAEALILGWMERHFRSPAVMEKNFEGSEIGEDEDPWHIRR